MDSVYNPVADTLQTAADAWGNFKASVAARVKANLIQGIVSDIPQFAERAPTLPLDRTKEGLSFWERLKLGANPTYQNLGAKAPTKAELETWDGQDLTKLRDVLDAPIRQAAQKSKEELTAIQTAAEKLREEIAAKLPEGKLAGQHYAELADQLRERLNAALAKENEIRKLTGEKPLTEDSLKEIHAAIDELKKISGEMVGTVKDTATLEAKRAELGAKKAAAEQLLQNFGCSCGGENGATGNARCVVAVPGKKALAWTSQILSDCTGYCAAIRRDRDCSRLAAAWGYKPFEEAQDKFVAAQKELAEFEQGLGNTASLMAKLDEQRKVVSKKTEIAGLTPPLAAQAPTANAPEVATNVAPVADVRGPASVPSANNVQLTAVSSGLNSVTVDLNVPGADVVNFGGQTFALTNGRGRFTFPTGCCGSSFPRMHVGSQGRWRFSQVLSIHGGRNVNVRYPTGFVSRPRWRIRPR